MRWTLFKEKQRGQEVFVIRRWVGGKNDRLPLQKYKRIREDYEALCGLVKRLNAPIDLREKVDFKHAFIDDNLLSDYEEHLGNAITGEGLVSTEMCYLKHYFLHYFITLQGKMNPATWIDIESKWLSYIIKDPKGPEGMKLKGIKAATTKRKVISAANRFMVWLHKRRPEEVPKVEFATIPKPKFNAIQAQRELDEATNNHVYIPKKDMLSILKSLPLKLEPFIHLMHKYGLRRSESLGLKPGDVKKGHIFLQRQLVRINVWAPLKGRDVRDVPHWFNTPNEAYMWIEAAQSHIVHPRTLSDRWTRYMATLGMNYTFHDLRHTWTTDAMRAHGTDPLKVRDAAGHENLSTTMQYLHREEKSDASEEWVPGDAA